MQVVLDTNILVSGLISKETPPYELQKLWLAGEFVLVTSMAQIEEIRRVFGYEKLTKLIAPSEAMELLEGIQAEARIVEPAWS